jgi:hypothetical protein
MLHKKTGSRILTMLMMTAVVFSIAAFSPKAAALSIAEVNASVGSVNLGAADEFAILSKTGVTTTGTTMVNGNIGVSPAAATYMTGFDLILDSTSTFSTSSLIVGKVYAADYALLTPTFLTTAVLDMEAAYTDAAGRTPDYIELYAGDLSGKTLTAGVYKYSNCVSINTDLTLNGDANDVFIFQIAGTLTQARRKHHLAGRRCCRNRNHCFLLRNDSCQNSHHPQYRCCRQRQTVSTNRCYDDC